MSGLQGEWKGFASIQTDGFGTLPTRSYRFILLLREAADGTLTGHADGPDIGVVRMPLEGLRLEGAELSCAISAMGARFSARPSASGSACPAKSHRLTGATMASTRRRRWWCRT